MTEALAYTGFGMLVLVAVWSPLFLQRIPISLPMVVLGTGAVLASLGPNEHPLLQHTWWVEHITSIALLVSVMGAGLRLDRPFSMRAWAGVWRLLVLVMPLSILGIAAAAYGLLGLSPAYALLVAAILAPTDPVLASEVGAGPPGSEDDSDTRFNLTGEAGLNDGLAFPFVLLGLAMLGSEGFDSGDFGLWAVRDLAWALAAGAASGVALGSALVWLNRRLPENRRLSATGSGFVALGLSLLAYGLSELVEGNGFVSVFLLAVTIRNAVHRVEYPRQLDHLLSEIEQLVMVVVIALFGVALGNGLMSHVGGREILFALVVLLALRPAASYLGLIGSGLSAKTRFAISYFGIRGLGSLFYLTYVLDQRADDVSSTVVTVVSLVVVASVVLYGISTQLVLRWVDPSRQPKER